VNSSIAALSTALVAFVISAAGVPLMKRLALRYEVVSKPSDDRWHREPTPLLGGVAVIAGFIVAILFFGHVEKWLVVGAVALLAVGAIDDTLVLSARAKLISQLLVVGLIMRKAPIFNILPWPPLNLLLTIFWFVLTINAVNLIDGLDGLAGGLGIASALTVAALAALHGQTMVLGWALALSGALAGFLLYNYKPASIFMGDAGALPVGFILGGLSIEASLLITNSWLAATAVPLLVVLVPVTDTLVVTIGRLAAGSSISRRGLDHFHHRLGKLGLSDRRVMQLMCALELGAGACAVILSLMRHFYIVATLSAGLLFFALIGLFLIDLNLDSTASARERDQRPRLARAILSLNLKRRVFEVILDGLLITVAYCAAVLIRLDFKVDPDLFHLLTVALPWVMAISYLAFFSSGIYRGTWRHFGLEDAMRFGQGAMLAAFLLFATGRFAPLRFSGSILCIFTILLFNLLVATRLSFRIFLKVIDFLARPSSSIIIVGANSGGEAALWHLFSDRGNRKIRMLGFVDDDTFKRGKLIHGYRVLGSIDELGRIYQECAFDSVLIAAEALAEERLELVRSFVRSRDLQLRRFIIGISDVAPGARSERKQPGSE
jgi:UDP-GlcNAc:undecaprenyl-phosphate GlcNAc-1-phosphate transferase